MGIFQKSKGNGSSEEANTMNQQKNSAQVTATDDVGNDKWKRKDQAPAVNSSPVEPKIETNADRKSAVYGYGIEKAVSLMRQLPEVDSEIIITVVKKTLESANVRVLDIITDAEKKENNIERRMQTLTSEIEELQKKISHRNKEISTLTADLKETSKVKQLLELGEAKAKQQANQNAKSAEMRTETNNAMQANDGGSDLSPPSFVADGKETHHKSAEN